MSLTSGIIFTPPNLPSSNSLVRISFSSSAGRAVAQRKIPSFPPLRIDQILKLIENGSSDAISILEWMHVFRQSIFFENNEDGERATILIWQAISENERLSRIALHLIGQYLNGQLKAFPKLLVESMYLAKPYLNGRNAERVYWLMSIHQSNFEQCIELAVTKNLPPTEMARTLNLPTSTLHRGELFKAISTRLLQAKSWTDESFARWAITSFGKATREELVEIINGIPVQQFSLVPIWKEWLTDRCHPDMNDSLWFFVSEETRQRLREAFQLGNFFILQALVDKLRKRLYPDHESSGSKNLRSRVNFWSNYSEKIGEIIFLFPEGQGLEQELMTLSNSTEYIVPYDDGQDGDNTACIFELDKVIVVVTLTGRASEIRLFDNTSRNRNRLLISKDLTLSDIRRMACMYVHDHVALWQYFCEKTLRVEFNIRPNKGTEYFKGLGREFGKYDSKKGLKRPSKDALDKRAEHLDNWFSAFMSREKALNVNSITNAKIKLQHAVLNKLKGDAVAYRKTLSEAVSLGCPEAMYFLALEAFSDITSSKSQKLEAETLLKRSASCGHEPAQNLCDKYNLSYVIENNPLIASEDNLAQGKPALKLAKKKLTPGTLIRLNSKIRHRAERPYLSLRIDELEMLATQIDEDKSIFSNLINELRVRKPTQRVKALLDGLLESVNNVCD